ncbi:MAG TPA: discoidin domain-containing protein [Melioribacteraceae bacterium]|nr:discoidin domain-containing protein [Melioribacteraceae bacterium]
MKTLNKVFCLVTIVIFSLLPQFLWGQQKIILDDFNNINGWKINASDLVSVIPSLAEGKDGSAVKIEYNFKSGSGYGGIQKEFKLKLPKNYIFSFDIKADSPDNTLEFKLIDKSGDNVWWVNLRNFSFPKNWTKLSFKKRNIIKAWGPLNLDKPIEIDKIEIIVTSINGGNGAVYIDNLSLEEKDVPDTNPQQPIFSASSFSNNNKAEFAGDGNLNTYWQSEGTDNQYFQLNFNKTIELGGLKLNWDLNNFPKAYKVLISDDKINWDTVYSISLAKGGIAFIPLKDCETSHIRFEFCNSNSLNFYKLNEVEVLPVEFSDSQNRMFEKISLNYPRGYYPKYFSPEKSYFTVSGVPNDTKEALINEEGQVEVDKQSFSIAPMLYINNKLITWNDVKLSQELESDYLPIPIVTWKSDDFLLQIKLFSSGADEKSNLNIKYTLFNNSNKNLEGKLFLTFIPFQVNPSYQFLNTTGGVSKIESISLENNIIKIDNKTIYVYPNNFNFGVTNFDNGFIAEYLAKGELPNSKTITDKQKLASAALSFDVSIPQNKDTVIYVTVPYHANPTIFAGDTNYNIFYSNLFNQVKMGWERLLNFTTFKLPESGDKLINTLRSTIAYILINKDKHGFQPGSRSYERSWIRDGSMTSSTMLKFGLTDEVKDFITWYAKYQFPNGKVPCVVDYRGADPVPENDSHGQFIFAAYQYFLFTKDTLFLKNIYPQIVKTVDYIQLLVNERSTKEYKTNPELKPFYGLVPESISHEGYSDKPMHSYWDNFFTIKGLKDAVEIAKILNNNNDIKRFTKLRDSFKENLYNSIKLSTTLHKINYLPGCVEKGDFDATSTTVALYPCNERPYLPKELLFNTFDKYFEFFKDRRDNTKYDWQNYTPYELRNAGAFLYLDQPERTHDLLDYFFKDQRPNGWNHWAEVVWKDPKLPRFIGDMPHTWVGSDYLTVARSMFVYENESANSLVIGAGLYKDWLNNPSGISINNLKTYYGNLSYSIKKHNNTYGINLEGNIKVPTGGIVIKNLLKGIKPKSVTINNKSIKTFNEEDIIINTFPATLLVEY